MKKALVFSLIFIFVLTVSASAVLEVPDDNSLSMIESALNEYIGNDMVIDSAWFIDFPSVTNERFYHVVVLLDEGRQEQIFYLNATTYDIIHEDVILDYQQQEANSDDPIMRITAISDDDSSLHVDSEQSDSSNDGSVRTTSNNNAFLAWGIPAGILTIALSLYVLKTKK